MCQHNGIKLRTQFFKENPNGKYLHFCHSQGAINTRNAALSFDPELMKNITIVAIAPGAYINPHLCNDVTHFLVPNDIVPLADVVGRVKYRDSVEVLRSHKTAPWWDHAVLSPTYKDKIEYNIIKFKNDNGIQ